MRKEVADLVFPVFRTAIEIKEGVRTNERNWPFAECQKRLLSLLQTLAPDHLRSEMGGEPRSLDATSLQARVITGFLGIRYALACWLDEIMIADCPWKDEWNANKIETTLYGTNERASKFWEQAQRAQTRPTRDALEVYYLCVMLGFRGEKTEASDLALWRNGVEAQITQGEEREYSPPPGLKVAPNVRPLTGARVMQKWFIILTMIGAFFIPLLFLLWSQGN